MRSYFSIVILLLWIDIHAAAQSPGSMKGFYGSMNLGAGIVSGNITNFNEGTSVQFGMHINVGFFMSKSVQVGVSGCGWLFESYMSNWTGEKGESVSDALLYIQLYPFVDYRMYFKTGYGVSRYKNNRPYTENGRGNALIAAFGYEINPGKKEFICGIQLSYHHGNLRYSNLYTPANYQDRRFNVIDLTLFYGLD